MLSTLSTTKSALLYNVKPKVVTPTTTTFSSFPSSIVCRYDLYSSTGRLSSTGTQVTTDNAHIYKIVNKANIGTYDLISRSTEANKFNFFVSSGLGTLNKPCVKIQGGTLTQIGYITQTNHPQFTNGMELLCVVKSNGDSSTYNRQTLISKTNSNVPRPFDIKFDNAFGNGTQYVSNPKSSGINWQRTETQGNIYNVSVLKSTGELSERQNGVQGYNQVLTNLASYFGDTSTSTPLYVSGRADSTLNYRWEIGEILLFNTKLSQSDRELLEGYLSTKWGITLDAAHPYYGKTVNYTGTNP